MSNSDSKAEKYNRTVEKAELLQIAATQGVFKISPEYAAKCDAATKLIDQQVIDEPAFDESLSLHAPSTAIINTRAPTVVRLIVAP